MTWYRLCVDIEDTGEVRGASYEQRDADSAIQIVVLNHVVYGPFDTVGEVATAILRLVTERHGLQLRLPGLH
jgi:hypothetical protein